MLTKLKIIIKSPKFVPISIFTLGAVVFTSVAINQLNGKNDKQSETIEVNNIDSEGEVAGTEEEISQSPTKSLTPTTKKTSPTKIPTPKLTNTPTPTPSPTPEPTDIPTLTPTQSPTSEPTPTETATPSATPA